MHAIPYFLIKCRFILGRSLLPYFLLLLLSFSSCKASWVAAYSERIDEMVRSTAAQTNNLYVVIEHAEDKKYNSYVEKYMEIELNINNIERENAARKKGADMAIQIKTVKDAFMRFKKDHKDRRTLNNAELKIYEMQMEAYWVALLRAERGLK